MKTRIFSTISTILTAVFLASIVVGCLPNGKEVEVASVVYLATERINLVLIDKAPEDERGKGICLPGLQEVAFASLGGKVFPAVVTHEVSPEDKAFEVRIALGGQIVPISHGDVVRFDNKAGEQIGNISLYLKTRTDLVWFVEVKDERFARHHIRIDVASAESSEFGQIPAKYYVLPDPSKIRYARIDNQMFPASVMQYVTDGKYSVKINLADKVVRVRHDQEIEFIGEAGSDVWTLRLYLKNYHSEGSPVHFFSPSWLESDTKATK